VGVIRPVLTIKPYYYHVLILTVLHSFSGSARGPGRKRSSPASRQRDRDGKAQRVEAKARDRDGKAQRSRRRPTSYGAAYSTRAGTLTCYKTAPPNTRFLFIVCPIMMMFIAVLSIFIIQVWSQTIIVNTTSGRLLGTQADGGMCSLYTLSSYSPQVIYRASGILQGHCKISTIARLKYHDRDVLLSALHTLLLEIYDGNLQSHLFLLTLKIRLPLAHRAFNNFLFKLSSRKCLVHLHQPKARTAFTCEFTHECVSKVADGSP
jgi:hypothetical protein